MRGVPRGLSSLVLYFVNSSQSGLASLNPQSYLFYLGKSPCSVWAPLPCAAAWKLQPVIWDSYWGSPHLPSFTLTLTIVECLKSAVSYILSGFIVVQSKKVNPVPVISSWIEAEMIFLCVCLREKNVCWSHFSSTLVLSCQTDASPDASLELIFQSDI